MAKVRRGKLLLTLLLFSPLVISGCGLGWLYMRIADSQRIKGLKGLVSSTSKDRFSDAEKDYKKAISNYRESILYDDEGNPSVYHKLGFTFLLATPPDLTEAENAFRDGIKVKRKQLDKAMAARPQPKPDKTDVGEDSKPPPPKVNDKAIEQRSAEETAIDAELEKEETLIKRDEDYAQCNAGLGMVCFLRGIKDQKDDQIILAQKYFRLAEKFSTHPSYKKKDGIVQKVLAYFDLDELVNPVPYMVLEARVLHYKARKLLEKGLVRLADSALGEASDALETAKAYYEYDSRYVLESAQWHFYKGELARLQASHATGIDWHKEFDAATAAVDSIKSTLAYSDMREGLLLKARACVRKGKVAEAEPIAQSILDKDSTDPQALLIMAHVYASKGKAESNNLATVVDTVTKSGDNKDNPYVLKEIGDSYQEMGDNLAAKSFYLQAYQHDSKNVFFLYPLGNIYQTLGEATNMKDCFGKLCQIEPSSIFCEEVKKWTQ